MPRANKKNLSKSECAIIVNVKAYLNGLRKKLKSLFLENHLDPDTIPCGLSDLTSATSQACAVSTRTVTRCSAFNDENNSSPKSVTKSGRKSIVFDSFTQSVIRNVCHQFYANKEYPTTSKIWLKCLEDENFSRVRKSTFHSWMINKCNFKYRKLFKKPVFLERTDILAHWEHYLRHIRHYRNANYKIYYCDETWTSPDQSRNRSWQILLKDSEIREFKDLWCRKVLQNVDGWTGGFLVKGGQGRVIINHIGNDDGFLDSVADVFRLKKDCKDYHNAMNGEHYLQWFKLVLEKIPDHSVIVLDQAPYHKNRVPGTIMPKMYWRKPKIVEWMQDHNIPLPEHVPNFNCMTMASMVELSKLYPVKERFIVEDLVRDSKKDVKLLWLPVAHCELNPIELIWAFVKGKVSELNTTGGTQNVYDLTHQCLELVTKDLWAGCVRQAIKYEDMFWNRDRLIERNLEVISNPNLVINLNDQSSSVYR